MWPAGATPEKKAEINATKKGMLEPLTSNVEANRARMKDLVAKSLENQSSLMENKAEISERRESIMNNRSAMSANRSQIWMSLLWFCWTYDKACGVSLEGLVKLSGSSWRPESFCTGPWPFRSKKGHYIPESLGQALIERSCLLLLITASLVKLRQ